MSPLPPRTPEDSSLLKTATNNNSPTTSPAKKEVDDETSVNPGNLKRTLTNPSISSDPPSPNPEVTNAPGLRAAEAFVRPAPIGINGTMTNYGFDLKNCEFHLEIRGTTPKDEEQPTTIFLPEYHFPKEQCVVEVSGGKWEISTDDDERAWVQKIRWWHGDGKQTMRVKGVVRPLGSGVGGSAEEAGYLEQCQQTYGVGVEKCSVM